MPIIHPDEVDDEIFNVRIRTPQASEPNPTSRFHQHPLRNAYITCVPRQKIRSRRASEEGRRGESVYVS